MRSLKIWCTTLALLMSAPFVLAKDATSPADADKAPAQGAKSGKKTPGKKKDSTPSPSR